MGSNSRSQSSQDTQNTNTTFGIQGDNLGNVINGNGNTVIDGGAFKIVQSLIDTLPGFGGVITDFLLSGERQNENVLNAGIDIFNGGLDIQRETARLGAEVMTEAGDVMRASVDSALDFGRSTANEAFRTVSDTANTAIEGNRLQSALVVDAVGRAGDNNTLIAGRAMDNATYLAESLGSKSMDNSAFLAESLARVALDASTEANENATNQLLSGFDHMMDFVDTYSRSDGADLAKTNNETMLIMGGGFAVLVVLLLVLVMRGRK